MRHLLCVLLLTSAAFAPPAPAAAASDPALRLPKVARVDVDGDLREWREVPVVRIGNEQHSSTPLQWRGSADCSVSLYHGWNEQGLYVAGRVFDDDVRREDNAAAGDHLQLFLSADPKAAGPLSRGVLKLLLAPPAGQQKPASITWPDSLKDSADTARAQVAETPTADGYTFELLVPLALVPGFVSLEASVVSVHLAIHDVDEGRVYPQKLSRGLGRADGGQFLRFRLDPADASAAPLALADVQLYTNLLIPDLVLDRQPTFGIEAAAGLVGAGSAVTVEVLDGADKVVASKDVPAASFAGADGLVRADVRLDLRALPDGPYTVATRLASSAAVTEPISIPSTITYAPSSADLVPATIAALESARLSELVEREPFKAAAYFGVVGAVEWLKWGLEQRSVHAVVDATREIRCRLAVLEGRELPEPVDSMYGLLELTRDPSAQLVVEYLRDRTASNPQNASLAIYWGSLPLVSATADTFATDADAAKGLAGRIANAPGVTTITIDGTEVHDVKQSVRDPFDVATFDPAIHLARLAEKKLVEIVPIEAAALHKPDGIYLFPGTDATVAATIRSAAAARKIRVVDEAAELRKLKAVLYAGTPDDSSAGRAIREAAGHFVTQVSPRTGALHFTKGRTTFAVPYVSRDAAVKFASIVLAGRPATAADADAIRQDILQATGRTPRPLVVPEGMELFCGDLHTHSFLSDGRTTPLTVTAAAVYCGLDFHVLTDHGVFRGALDHIDSLKAHGLNYPVIAGAELNTRWGHVNIYPLDRDGGYVMGPTLKHVIDHAHGLGAAIQWNHPDTSYSNLPDLLANGIAGSGFDAWEHYPPQYSKWKAEGKLPVLSGGSDTHNGTFHMPERSLLLMPDAAGQTLADSVKAGRILLLDPWNGSYTITRSMENKSRWDSDLYFYGPDEQIQFAVDVLADPDYLKTLKIRRLKQYLQGIDIRRLIDASSAHETVK